MQMNPVRMKALKNAEFSNFLQLWGHTGLLEHTEVDSVSRQQILKSSPSTMSAPRLSLISLLNVPNVLLPI